MKEAQHRQRLKDPWAVRRKGGVPLSAKQSAHKQVQLQHRQSRAQSITQNNMQNALPLRAKRETDPNFVGPFAYDIRNHSVNSGSRQKQCCQREETDHFH